MLPTVSGWHGPPGHRGTRPAPQGHRSNGKIGARGGSLYLSGAPWRTVYTGWRSCRCKSGSVSLRSAIFCRRTLHEPCQAHRRVPSAGAQARHHQQAVVVRGADLRRRRRKRASVLRRGTTVPPRQGCTKAKTAVVAVTACVTSASRGGTQDGGGSPNVRPSPSETCAASRPATLVAAVSDGCGVPVRPASTSTRRGGARRVAEPRIVDQPPPAGVAAIGHHQRGPPDRQRQRPPLRRFPAQDQRIGRPQHRMQVEQPHPPYRSAAGSRARASSSQDRRGPSSTAGSHTRLMSSSTKRERVGWRGSKRSNAARLTKPNVSRPRAGRSPARSSRSSTIAPAISLPCEIASSATCGPGAAAATRRETRAPRCCPPARAPGPAPCSRTSNRGSGRQR